MQPAGAITRCRPKNLSRDPEVTSRRGSHTQRSLRFYLQQPPYSVSRSPSVWSPLFCGYFFTLLSFLRFLTLATTRPLTKLSSSFSGFSCHLSRPRSLQQLLCKVNFLLLFPSLNYTNQHQHTVGTLLCFISPNIYLPFAGGWGSFPFFPRGDNNVGPRQGSPLGKATRDFPPSCQLLRAVVRSSKQAQQNWKRCQKGANGTHSH